MNSQPPPSARGKDALFFNTGETAGDCQRQRNHGGVGGCKVHASVQAVRLEGGAHEDVHGERMACPSG